MDKYLILSSKNGGDFIESDDKNAPFIVYNFEMWGDWGSNTFDFELKFSMFDDKVKNIIREHPDFFDIDSYQCSLEEANDAKIRRGKVFFQRRKGSPDVWKNNIKIKVVLLASKNKNISNTPKNSKTGNKKCPDVSPQLEQNSISDKSAKKAYNLSGGKYISENVVEWGTDDIKESLAELRNKEKTNYVEDVKTNEELIKHKDTKNINSKGSQTSVFDNTQYLMSGREDEPFFYEGSTIDPSGASFRIDYDRLSMKGEYSLIVDMNNLRTINPAFRREVIKLINNGTTIREASAFTVVSKGKTHFSKEDCVWIVDEPLVIKLIR